MTQEFHRGRLKIRHLKICISSTSTTAISDAPTCSRIVSISLRLALSGDGSGTFSSTSLYMRLATASVLTISARTCFVPRTAMKEIFRYESSARVRLRTDVRPKSNKGTEGDQCTLQHGDLLTGFQLRRSVRFEHPRINMESRDHGS